MIYRHKYAEVEVRELPHDGTFSTRAGMVQAKKGDFLVYDPAKVVYVVGENPRDNAHNFDLVSKADFEKSFEPLPDAKEDAKLDPVLTDLGVHQFDDQGRFLGYRSLVDEGALKEAEDNRIAAAAAEGKRQDDEEAQLRARLKAKEDAKAKLDAAQKKEADAKANAEAKKLSDAQESSKLDAENAKADEAAKGAPTQPVTVQIKEPIKASIEKGE